MNLKGVVDTPASRLLLARKLEDAEQKMEKLKRTTPASLRVHRLTARKPGERQKRFDKWLQKCYNSQRPSKEELAEVARMVFLELAVFGEDEKVRLLAAKELRVEGGGREEQKDDGVLDEIRRDLARSQEESAG